MNPLSTTGLILLCFLILVLPRNKAFIPIFLGACFYTLGQKIMIGSLDFYFFRLILLFGMVRVVIRKEFSEIKFTRIDTIVILWLIIGSVFNIILYKTMENFVARLGLIYNAVGSYWLFRIFVRDMSDYRKIFIAFSLIIIPLGITMAVEKATGRNLFYILGGVPEFSQIRYGKVRCQGSFSHPILMGTFGATLMPFFIALWWQQGGRKILAVIGCLAASVVTLTPNSSGPLLAVGMDSIAMGLILFQRHVGTLRRIIYISLFFLHFAMNAPVWYLMAKIGSSIGGTGWHRAFLIDQAIHYFRDWWLIGTRVTVHWIGQAIPDNPNSADITNHYIAQGVAGGVLTMILFILIIVRGFQYVGTAMNYASSWTFQERIIIWALGASLFGHVISFISVSYFDQIIVFWYLILAMIAALEGIINSRIEEEALEAQDQT